MLSVDFSTPLAGHARQERLKQMANTHPSFQKASEMHTSLVNIQTSLRRMPGISANEANEIAEELQEVGRTMNREMGHLVEAVVSMKLDQEETDKALARMSLSGNLAKAQTDDQKQVITNLKTEMGKKQELESKLKDDLNKLMRDFEDLSTDYKKLQQKLEGSSKDGSPESSEKVKALQLKIEHLEEQVQARRSIWVMKHNDDPKEVVRAMETLAESVQDDPKLRSIIDYAKSINFHNLKPSEAPQQNGASSAYALEEAPRLLGNTSRRPSAGVNLAGRPSGGAGHTRYGSFHMENRDNTAVMPYDRQKTPFWGPKGAGRATPGGPGPGPGAARWGNNNNYALPPPRNNAWGNGPRNTDVSAGTKGAFARRPSISSRPPSSFGFGRDAFPKTPTRNGRGGPHYGGSSFSSPRSVWDTVAPVPIPGRGNQQHMAAPHPHPPPGLPPVPPEMPAGAPHPPEPPTTNWEELMYNFYEAVRTFVDNNAAEVNMDITVEELAGCEVWPILVDMYNPLSEAEAASYMEHHVREKVPKPCLVIRVVVDFIVNRVWSLAGWTNIDEESTIALAELDREFERTAAQPSVMRQPLLDRQATIIEAIYRRERHSPLQKQKVTEIAGTLLSYLRPLLNKRANPSDAYRDLEEVALQAWDLSFRILSSRLTFDFRFPQIGARFSQQSMLPIWPDLDALELQARHWRVALVTTPVVTCRNDMGSNISAHSVSLADVVCMQ